ncbi:unnamed protein product [Lactuca virosa]|uniref:Uncharacterized protein n=1 Tax=Lactuca virosa TaxID=75947 RepID=A0AAU9PJK1_9ASTR|nr:unnamed protein product [Lactuca virosa]
MAPCLYGTAATFVEDIPVVIEARLRHQYLAIVAAPPLPGMQPAAATPPSDAIDAPVAGGNEESHVETESMSRRRRPSDVRLNRCCGREKGRSNLLLWVLMSLSPTPTPSLHLFPPSTVAVVTCAAAAGTTRWVVGLFVRSSVWV